MFASIAATRRVTSDAAVTWHRLLRWRRRPRTCRELEQTVVMAAAPTHAPPAPRPPLGTIVANASGSDSRRQRRRGLLVYSLLWAALLRVATSATV